MLQDSFKSHHHLYHRVLYSSLPRSLTGLHPGHRTGVPQGAAPCRQQEPCRQSRRPQVAAHPRTRLGRSARLSRHTYRHLLCPPLLRLFPADAAHFGDDHHPHGRHCRRHHRSHAAHPVSDRNSARSLHLPHHGPPNRPLPPPVEHRPRARRPGPAAQPHCRSGHHQCHQPH